MPIFCQVDMSYLITLRSYPLRVLVTSEEVTYAESYAMYPGVVVGPSKGPVRWFVRFITELAFKHNMLFISGKALTSFSIRRQRVLLIAAPRRRVFDIRSRKGAKASPYARYYIPISTPLDVATVFGQTLKKLGKIEDPCRRASP